MKWRRAQYCRLQSTSILLVFSNMSQVIYARVPEAVKADVEEYAEAKGMTLSSAAVDLFQRGLAASGEEASIANLESRVATMSAENAALEAKLQGAVNEVGALRSFAQRASSTRVGTCPAPGCKAAISGMDLLGQNQCRECGTSLMQLLAPRAQTSKPLLDDREVGALVGALGVVLIAAAVLGSKGLTT